MRETGLDLLNKRDLEIIHILLKVVFFSEEHLPGDLVTLYWKAKVDELTNEILSLEEIYSKIGHN